jgi:hypothetical protein
MKNIIFIKISKYLKRYKKYMNKTYIKNSPDERAYNLQCTLENIHRYLNETSDLFNTYNLYKANRSLIITKELQYELRYYLSFIDKLNKDQGLVLKINEFDELERLMLSLQSRLILLLDESISIIEKNQK